MHAVSSNAGFATGVTGVFRAGRPVPQRASTVVRDAPDAAPNFVKMVPEGDERERDVCRDCGFVDYRNPKVVVGCLPCWVRVQSAFDRPPAVFPSRARSIRTRCRRVPLVDRDLTPLRSSRSAPRKRLQTDGSGRTRVLLCRRGIEPRIGKWGFPQGFMEIGESTRDGAARETAEEAGATVVPGPLLAVYNLPGQVQLLYLAEVVGGDDEANRTSASLEPDPPPTCCGIETLETAFFAWDELPEGDDLAFPTVAWALEFARDVAEKRWREREPFVPQQRTKLFFGAPADGDVAFLEEA